MGTNYAARGRGGERLGGDESAPGSLALARAGFALAVAAQVWVLYLYVPGGSDPVSFPQADKVVHTVVFAVPALLGVLARLRPWLVGLVLVVHAPVSELVQHLWVPGRAGDPWDVVADLVGVLVGLAIGSALVRRRPVRGAPLSPSRPGADRAT